MYTGHGAIERLLPDSRLEPFVLWRVQPSVPIESSAKAKTGRQDEQAYGFRFKGVAAKSLDYFYEAILQRGSDGPNPIRAWAQTFGAAYRHLPRRTTTGPTYTYPYFAINFKDNGSRGN